LKNVLFMSIVSLFLAATASAQPAEPAFLGKPRLHGSPERVVSLAPNLTEIVFAIGAGERLVGVTRFDDYPEHVKKLPKVGGFVDPSVEGIMALDPQLIICVPNPGGRDKLDVITRLGVPVLVLPSYTLDNIYKAIVRLGVVFNREKSAGILVADMKARIAAIRARVAGRPRPKVILIYGHRPLVAAGHGSFADTLLTIAGGDNLLGNSRVRYPSIPIEALIKMAPDVIIDASSGGKDAETTETEVREEWRRWKVVPAVKNGRVHALNSSLFFRPGPRIVEGLSSLAKILHPEPASDK
jgi:iron complex transport system substrate-binding protein